MLGRGKEETLPNTCPLMFSVPDIAVVAVLALLLFGPDKLPGMMRTAGRFMREVQNTSQAFVTEMERAADVQDQQKRTMQPVVPVAAAPVAASAPSAPVTPPTTDATIE